MPTFNLAHALTAMIEDSGDAEILKMIRAGEVLFVKIRADGQEFALTAHVTGKDDRGRALIFGETFGTAFDYVGEVVRGHSVARPTERFARELKSYGVDSLGALFAFDPASRG